MTAPAEQQQDDSTEEALIALVAGYLAAAGSAAAGSAALDTAQAAVAVALTRAGLSRDQARHLVALDATRPVAPAIPLTSVARRTTADGPTNRARYLINAAKRVAKAAASPDDTIADQLGKERRYFAAHQTAQQARQHAAQQVDAAANSYGPTLGWYAVLDERTTPECRAAHRHNFTPEKPPKIGLPGLKHAGNCRCRPGPPIAGAGTVDEATGHHHGEPIAATREVNPAVTIALATSSASLDRSPRKNWVENNGGLPPGVRKVARKLKELYPSWSWERCIATAISKSKKWAAQGSAKGARNTAQWEALKAKAGSKNLASDAPALTLAWDEAAHPRAEAGQPTGGEFIAKDSSGKSSGNRATGKGKTAPKGKGRPTSKTDGKPIPRDKDDDKAKTAAGKGKTPRKGATVDPKAKALWDAMSKMSPAEQAKYLAGLSDADLQALGRGAFASGQSTTDAMIAARQKVAGELSKRGLVIGKAPKAAPKGKTGGGKSGSSGGSGGGKSGGGSGGGKSSGGGGKSGGGSGSGGGKSSSSKGSSSKGSGSSGGSSGGGSSSSRKPPSKPQNRPAGSSTPAKPNKPGTGQQGPSGKPAGAPAPGQVPPKTMRAAAALAKKRGISVRKALRILLRAQRARRLVEMAHNCPDCARVIQLAVTGRG